MKAGRQDLPYFPNLFNDALWILEAVIVLESNVPYNSGTGAWEGKRQDANW